MYCVTVLRISIHAAREGGDFITSSFFRSISAFQSTPPVKAATNIFFRYASSSVFQSTPPVKAATCLPLYFLSNPAISIHAAREGGDF